MVPKSQQSLNKMGEWEAGGQDCKSILKLLEVIEMFIIFYFDDDFMGVYSCQSLLNCTFYIHGLSCMWLHQ